MRQGVPKGRFKLQCLILSGLFASVKTLAAEPTLRAAHSLTAQELAGKAEPSLPVQNLGTVAPLGLDVTTIAFRSDQASASDSRGRLFPLSLDRQIQLNATALLRVAKPRKGAVVVLRAADGKVLAAADYPVDTPRLESVLWSALTPSASLFKLVTTAALIERAELAPTHRVCSAGGEHQINGEQLAAPKGDNVRCQPFASILATSRNAAYARLVANHLSSEDVSNYADRFGFNTSPTASLPIELGRYTPSYSPLGVARTATGFIGSSLSVFGAANLGMIIANGGRWVKIRLLDPQASTESDSSAHSDDGSEQAILPQTARRLREMMEQVVRAGTAHGAFHDDVGRPVLGNMSVAGKTGTLGHDEETSSWFVGFAPSRAPEIVVAVLLDNGPVWRTTAKMVAAAVLEHYFSREKPRGAGRLEHADNLKVGAYARKRLLP